jgi:predicted acylesterase/phospholipase RssA
VQKGRPFVYLALSGGGGGGAFGAGVLNGWSESGTRPEFSVVSGVSTGAPIAPFAFLGPDYDDRLRQIYAYGEARRLIGRSIPWERSLVLGRRIPSACAGWWGVSR